jgi:hypothetical protein
MLRERWSACGSSFCALRASSRAAAPHDAKAARQQVLVKGMSRDSDFALHDFSPLQRVEGIVGVFAPRSVLLG